MSTATAFFYLYGAVALAGAIGLVAARNLVHGVMSFFATLLSIAALYMLLGSQFLAAMQLFVYGGAITVLVLFVLMLVRAAPEETSRRRNAIRWTSAVMCVVFFGALARIIGAHDWALAAPHLQDTASLATILFSRYVLPFEIAGMSLTIALIGTIVLAREDDVMAAARAAEAGDA
jgi:NADH-quinone oxidoreductase subunit J